MKTASSYPKNERLQIRIDQESYDLLQNAASYSKEKLSNFVKEAALTAAKKILKSQKNVFLSKADIKLLLNTLENPPEPNLNLENALKHYMANNKNA